MPEPASGESEREFVSRCIEQTLNDGTTDDQAQAAAICYSKWRGKSMNENQKHEALIQAVLARKGKGVRFGQGIWTADKYVSSIAECIGVGMCQRYFAADHKFGDVIKEAASKLTYAGPDLDITENKLATAATDIKKMLGGDDLPKHALLAFTHVLTTPKEDRDGDILMTEGAVVDEKMPLLWQHLHTMPIGRLLKTVEHTPEHLKLASVLLDLNELTSDAAKLIEAGALRFSHGFRALDFTERSKEKTGGAGFRVKSFEIMEESLVSVPSNVEAEIELLGKRKLKSEVFKAHAEFMQRNLRLKKSQHPGVTLKLSSMKDLKQAADDGVVKSLVAQGITTIESGDVAGASREAVVEKNPGEHAGHDHDAPYGFCPMCGAKGIERERCLNGNDHCEQGHVYPSKMAAKTSPGKKPCGCGGKCGNPECKKDGVAGMSSTPSQGGGAPVGAKYEFKTAEEAIKQSFDMHCRGFHRWLNLKGDLVYRPCETAMDFYAVAGGKEDGKSAKVNFATFDEFKAAADAGQITIGGKPFEIDKASIDRESFGTREEAEARATILGCTGSHFSEGKWHPCQDEWSYMLYAKPTVDPALTKPTGRASAKPGGEKIYLDGSSIRGSYANRMSALQSDAARFLMGAGEDIDANDYPYIWALFDDYGIIAVREYGDDECYYRAEWADSADGPKWTGVPTEVEVSSNIDIQEASGKTFGYLLGAALGGLNVGIQVDGIKDADEAMQALQQALQRKAGRALSQANVDKLQSVIDDLKELAGMSGMPRAAAALAERCHSQIEGMMDGAGGKDDDGDEGKDKSVTPRDALEIFLADADADMLAKARQTIDSLTKLNRASAKSEKLKKLLRRQ